MSFYAAMAKAASRLVEQYGMEARWYSQEAVSSSCSVTLFTPGLGSALESEPYTSVSGQTVTLEYTGTTEELFVASEKESLAENYGLGWSGRRAFGASIVETSDPTQPHSLFWGDISQDKVAGFNYGGAGWQGAGWSLTGTQDPVINPYIVIDGDTGTVEWWDGDTLRDTVANFFNVASDTGQLMFISTPEAPVSAELTLITEPTGVSLDGADDWCGNSTGGSGFDPVTGKNTGVSDVPHLVQSVFVETDVSLVDGSRIESGRKVILMDGSQTPTTGWKLDADYTGGVPAAGSFPGAISGGVRGRWTVVEVKEINPAGIPLLYELQVMQ